MADKRQCFIVLADQFDDNGFIPSLVTEGEAGHAPLKGNGRLSTPWYWGKTYDKAKEVCAEENHRLGLTDDDVITITASSMRGQW